MKILIRMPNWLGDIVMAEPLLQEICAAKPNATIDVVCLKGPHLLLKGHPNIHSIIPFDRQDKAKALGQLQEENYDYAILTTNSFSSAWDFFRARIGKRVGFKRDCRRWFLNYGINYTPSLDHIHLVDTYKKLLSPMDIEPREFAPKLHISEQEKLEIQHRLSAMGIPENAPVIGVNPGAAYGSAKCWLPDRFKEVVKQVIHCRPDVHVVYFGDDSMQPLVNKLMDSADTRVHSLCGKTTIRELMAAISCMSVFLTNDSGPMHIAVAFQVPLVALFGSTNEVKTGPYKWGTIVRKKVECAPCYKRVCPIDFRCMKKIESNEVFKAIVEILPC